MSREHNLLAAIAEASWLAIILRCIGWFLGGLALLIFYFFLLALVAGCADVPQARTDVQRNDIAVQVPCKTKDVAAPAWRMDVVPAASDVHTLAKNALAELEQRKAYETQLKAANAACQ